MFLENGTGTVVSLGSAAEAVHLGRDGGTKSNHLSPEVGIESNYTLKIGFGIRSCLVLGCFEQFIGLGDDVGISWDGLGSESNHNVDKSFVGILSWDSGL